MRVSTLMQFLRYKSSASGVIAVPAYERKPLLDAAPRELYDHLMAAIGSQSKVLLKVRLADLVKNPGQNPRFRAHWLRVQRRSVDFLLVSRSTLAPVIAIKLETKADNKRRRLQGLDVLEEVLRDINVPLLRLPVQEHYDAKDVVKKMRFTLADHKQNGNAAQVATAEEEARVDPNQVVAKFARENLPTLSRWTSGLWMAARNAARAVH